MWGLLTDPDNRLQEDGLLLAVQQRRRSSSLVAAAPARPIAMSCGVGVTLRSVAACASAFAAVAVSGFAPASRRACLPIARAFAS
jgi:hypothetical protein